MPRLVVSTACLLATVWLSRGSAVAAPCGPRAVLDGDPPAVDQVARELDRLGVETSPPPGGCRAVHARIAMRDGQLVVSIEDPTAGTRESRTVSSAQVASAWIDSWLLGELDATWPATRPAPVPAFERIDRIERTDHAESSEADHWTFGADYETTFDERGATWIGAGGGLCVQLGRVCVGGHVRYAHLRQELDGFAAGRADVAAMATAAMPFELGRVHVLPEVGAGVGWLETRREEITTPCKVCDNLVESSVTPRLSAALHVALRVVAPVWLEALGAVTVRPGAHSASYPSTLYMSDVNMALPGEPRFGVVLGLGLRIGAQ